MNDMATKEDKRKDDLLMDVQSDIIELSGIISTAIGLVRSSWSNLHQVQCMQKGVPAFERQLTLF